MSDMPSFHTPRGNAGKVCGLPTIAAPDGCSGVLYSVTDWHSKRWPVARVVRKLARNREVSTKAASAAIRYLADCLLAPHGKAEVIGDKGIKLSGGMASKATEWDANGKVKVAL